MEEQNIFEGANFGDKYCTRDGRVAIFLQFDEISNAYADKTNVAYVYTIQDGEYEVLLNGRSNVYDNDDEKYGYDIVSKWKTVTNTENSFEVSNDTVEEENVIEMQFLSGNIPLDTTIISKIYSKIFDTNFYWGMPYLIDVDKYKDVIGKEHRMTDDNTRSVKFTCEMWRGEYDCSSTNFTLYVQTNNKDIKADEWDYDCYLKSNDGDNYTFEDFKTFITKVTECIIGVDTESAYDEYIKRNNEIENLVNINKELLKKMR